MESLVLELQREAYMSNTSVIDLTRKAYVLARKLSVTELMLWLKQEMEGYKDNKFEDVPSYRLVQGQLKAYNPYRVSPYSNNAYNHVAPLGTIKVSIKGGAFHCHSKN